MQDGPSQLRRSVIDVRHRTLGKKIETLRRGVSDCYDGQAGRTVMGTTVHHMCPLGKGARACATDPTTVRRGYDGPSSGSRSE